MSHVALVEPTSLLGQSLREALDAAPDHTLELFGLDEEDYGTLTEVGAEITLVRPLTTEGLEACDVAVICGSGSRQREALAAVPESMSAILVASDFDHPPGDLRLGGRGSWDQGSRVVVSPHPVVVLLARLLEAVAEHDPTRISGSIVLPASIHGGGALDELFEQTRAILSFSDERPSEIFGQQLAFNLLPAIRRGPVGTQVRQVLSADLEVSVDLQQGAVFHGLSASLLLEYSSGAGPESIEASLDTSPHVEIAQGEALLGPIDVAGRDELLVAPVRADEDRPDAVWLWAVMDNLTAGGAANVLELLRDPSPADA